MENRPTTWIHLTFFKAFSHSSAVLRWCEVIVNTSLDSSWPADAFTISSRPVIFPEVLPDRRPSTAIIKEVPVNKQKIKIKTYKQLTNKMFACLFNGGVHARVCVNMRWGMWHTTSSQQRNEFIFYFHYYHCCSCYYHQYYYYYYYLQKKKRKKYIYQRRESSALLHTIASYLINRFSDQKNNFDVYLISNQYSPCNRNGRCKCCLHKRS